MLAPFPFPPPSAAQTEGHPVDTEGLHDLAVDKTVRPPALEFASKPGFLEHSYLRNGRPMSDDGGIEVFSSLQTIRTWLV